MKDSLLSLGLIVAVFLLLTIQEFIPPMEFFGGARVNLVPMLFVYGALVVPFPLMLLLAVAIGLLSDLAILQVVGGSAEIGLGWSILFFLAVGLICQGLRPLILRGHWEIHPLMSALTAIVYLALQFGMITLRRFEDGGFFYSDAVTWRILGPGIITLIIALPFWFGMAFLTGQMGRRYRGLAA
jgi:hypothetical protein